MPFLAYSSTISTPGNSEKVKSRHISFEPPSSVFGGGGSGGWGERGEHQYPDSYHAKREKREKRERRVRTE